MSPTERTIELLRSEGWTCTIVERWNAHVRIRQDLFGFADVLAVHPEHGTVAIQACVGSSRAAREQKVRDEPRAWACIAAGWRVEVWSWARYKRRAPGDRRQWRETRTAIALVAAP